MDQQSAQSFESIGTANLVQQIREGNKQAEEMLFQHFSGRIDFLVRFRLGKENSDWEDLSNNIKLAVLLNLREGKFDLKRNTSLYSYICGVARNLINKYFRDRDQRTVRMNYHHLPGVITREQGQFKLESEELQKRLQILIDNLDDKYRNVLKLKYYNNLPVRDIGQILDLPPQKVSERLNYAVKLLRKNISVIKFYT